MAIAAVFAGIGQLCVRFRWLVLLFWIAASLLAATLLPALASVTQGDNTKFLPDSAPTQKATALAAPFGTADLFPVPVIVARGDSALTATDLQSVTELEGRLKSVTHVVKVQDAGRSADGQAEQLVAFVRIAGGDNNQLIALVDDLRAAVSATGLPAGLSAHLSGPVATQVDQQEASGNQSSQVEALSSLFIIALLVVIFRSLSLSLTTLIPAFLSVGISGSLVAEAAQHGLQVSPLAQFLLIVLVLGAGTDYGLFLVFRVREELRGRSHDEAGALYPGTSGLGRSVLCDLRAAREPARGAIVESVTRVGESIAASAGTVIIAMLTLLLASFPFYRDLGLPFAIAIVVTLLAALTLLPALLSIRLSVLALKRSVFQTWFHQPKLVPWSIQGRGGAGLWGRLAGRIVRHPWPTLVAGVLLFGGLSVGVLGYASSGFEGDTAPPAGSDSAAGKALQDQHFPQSAADPTALLYRFATPVWQDPAPVVAATRQLAASPQFAHLTGPLNPAGNPLPATDYTRLHATLGPAGALAAAPPASGTVSPAQYLLYRATANYVSPDGLTVQFTADLTAGASASTAAMDATPTVREAVTAVGRSVQATDSGVLGQASALYDISSISASDLTKIVPIAILAIGLLLGLVLRSVVAPLYLIASVGISYLAALGLAVILFVKIGGDGGLVFFMPFLMFIFLLALGEDYNILIMSRIREEAHDLPLGEAVVKALSSTGTTITSAGLVLAGSFIVLTAVAGGGSGGAQIRDIGLGLAFGILMDTFLVRTLLVPSTVVLLGRWNWWPSHLSGRTAAE